MTLPIWPSTVITLMREDGYREQPERNVDGFAVDHGPPLETRAQSIPQIVISGTIQCRSQAEYEDLLSFYADDLKDGVLHFKRTHPRTQEADCEFKFDNSIELVRVFGDMHEVAVVMRYFPKIL